MEVTRGLVLVAILVAACGGDVHDGAIGGHSGSAGTGGNRQDSGVSSGGSGAADGASPITALDAGTPTEKVAACTHLFTAMNTCDISGGRPPSEVARIQARFTASCLDEFLLPGETHAAADLEACARATEAVNCGQPSGVPRECDIRGSLHAGAACVLGSQCASGACTGATMPGPTPGAPGIATCGACAPVGQVGDTCDRNCAKELACMPMGGEPSRPNFTCQPFTPIAEGASCGNLGAVCASGLVCGLLDQCHAPVSLGANCGYGATPDCIPPLVCTNDGTCQRPGAAKAPCGGYDSLCGAGLACSVDQFCEPIEWEKPGAGCDGVLKRCLVGNCNGSAKADGGFVGACPAVVADGTKCSAADTCDAFFVCGNSAANPTSGTCQPITALRCPSSGGS